jgi:hypothetical protein
MKRLLTVLLLLTAAAFAQGVRIGDGTPVASTLNLSGVGNILTPSSTAAIAICTYPANAVPCTNKATTYTTQALSVACATSVQVTLPGTSSCVANADSLGNWGAWVAPGSYDYTITVGSHSYGPYTVTNGTFAATANSALKDAIQDKGFVNVVTDCGAVGNGVADDYTAIQNCITNNPGKIIGFPQMFSPGSGAGTATPTNYISSQRLTVSSNSQILKGLVGNTRYLGGVKIKFPAGQGGILLSTTAASAGIEDLFLEGSDGANTSSITTWEDYNTIASITGMTTSGITLAGTSQHVYGSRISQFKGHGIEVYGGSGGQPDNWHISDVWADSNRGFGLFVKGTDANVGLAERLSLTGNILGGLYENANYGNTYSVIHTDTNARNGFAAGSNKAITAATGLTVASNVLTIATDVPNTWSVNQWVTTTGSTDTTFNGTCKLLTVATSSATCNFTHADGSTGGGTAATSSGTQILAYYIAAGIQTGPFSIPSFSSGGRLLLTPYAEATQSASVFSPDTITLNQQGTTITGATTGHHMWAKSGPEWVFAGGNFVFRPLISADLFVLRNVANDTNMFQLDVSGNMTALGSVYKFGTTPATTGVFRVPKDFSIFGRKGDNTADIRGLFLWSVDNQWYVGDTTGVVLNGPTSAASSLTVTTTLGVTGVSTLTGGMKAGASGSTISDSRELVQNAHSCGTTTTCANTANGSNRIIFGSVALTSATPSTAVVSSITAFTSTSSYVCTLTNQTNAANNLLKVVNTSTTSFTITGPNTITDVIGYICIGS